MNITVRQNPSSLRSEYEISTPGCIYLAQKKLLSLRDKITLMGPHNHVVARIAGHFSILRARHDFELADGTVYRFEREKMWKVVFACDSDRESYRLYEHKGLNYSVFLSDRQIAAFTKNSVKIGKGDRYEIRMNDDANLFVVVCMVLTIDAIENEGDRASVTYDFGHLLGDRPFDKSWEPS